MLVKVGEQYKTKYGILTCKKVSRNKADFSCIGFRYINVPCSLIHIKPVRRSRVVN